MMYNNTNGYEVTTSFQGKQVTQYFGFKPMPLSALIEEVIISHYLWETVPIMKMLLKPRKGEQWTKL